jgi:hypothetical protein
MDTELVFQQHQGRTEGEPLNLTQSFEQAATEPGGPSSLVPNAVQDGGNPALSFGTAAGDSGLLLGAVGGGGPQHNEGDSLATVNLQNKPGGGWGLQPQIQPPAGGNQHQLQGGGQIQGQFLTPPSDGQQQFPFGGGGAHLPLRGGVQLQQSPGPGGPQQGLIEGALQAMQGLTMSPETAAFHQELAARSAELAARTAELQERIRRKQTLGNSTSAVCTAGAPLVGSSPSLAVPNALAATVAPRSQVLPQGRVFKPHRSRLPPRSKAVSLEAIRKASASAAQCLSGKPGKQPANLYAQLLERFPAITTYDHKSTLCLPERASSFSNPAGTGH